MKADGLKFNGKLAYAKTVMYWRLNHEVVPKFIKGGENCEKVSVRYFQRF